MLWSSVKNLALYIKWCVWIWCSRKWGWSVGHQGGHRPGRDSGWSWKVPGRRSIWSMSLRYYAVMQVTEKASPNRWSANWLPSPQLWAWTLKWQQLKAFQSYCTMSPLTVLWVVHKRQTKPFKCLFMYDWVTGLHHWANLWFYIWIML